MKEGRINDLEFSKIWEIQENFDIVTRNVYQDAKHTLYPRLEDKHKVMDIEEFRHLAQYANLRLYKKLIAGKINFEIFQSEIFKDKNKLEKLCHDNLVREFGEEIFQNNEGMKELIDDICRYRNTKDRVDVLLNDPLLKIDMRCLKRTFSVSNSKLYTASKANNNEYEDNESYSTILPPNNSYVDVRIWVINSIDFSDTEGKT